MPPKDQTNEEKLPQETNKGWEDELRNLIDDVRAGMKDDAWIYKLIRNEKQKSYEEGKMEVLGEMSFMGSICGVSLYLKTKDTELLKEVSKFLEEKTKVKLKTDEEIDAEIRGITLRKEI